MVCAKEGRGKLKCEGLRADEEGAAGGGVRNESRRQPSDARSREVEGQMYVHVCSLIHVHVHVNLHM